MPRPTVERPTAAWADGNAALQGLAVEEIRQALGDGARVHELERVIGLRDPQLLGVRHPLLDQLVALVEHRARFLPDDREHRLLNAPRN